MPVTYFLWNWQPIWPGIVTVQKWEWRPMIKHMQQWELRSLLKHCKTCISDRISEWAEVIVGICATVGTGYYCSHRSLQQWPEVNVLTLLQQGLTWCDIRTPLECHCTSESTPFQSCVTKYPEVTELGIWIKISLFLFQASFCIKFVILFLF